MGRHCHRWSRPAAVGSTAAVGDKARSTSAFWLISARRHGSRSSALGVFEIHGRYLLPKSKNPARRAAKRGVVVRVTTISSFPGPRPSSRGAMAAQIDAVKAGIILTPKASPAAAEEAGEAQWPQGVW